MELTTIMANVFTICPWCGGEGKRKSSEETQKHPPNS